jgi:Uma2 family endonuclease
VHEKQNAPSIRTGVLFCKINFMSALPSRDYISEEEYFAIDVAAERKHEYFDGQIWEMAGGSPTHAQLIANVQATIVAHLRGRSCYGTSGEQRVRAGKLLTYPDAAIVCPPPSFDPNNKDTLLNPIALFEVLSPSTREWDRAGKFDHYANIESLSDYVLVDQDWVRVEHYRRLERDEWARQIFVLRADQLAIALPDGVLNLPLDEIYDRFDLPQGLAPAPYPAA